MFNILFKLTNIFGAGHGSSFLSAGYIGTFFLNLFSKVINFLMQILWVILKFIFGVMEAFEYMIHSFLGIGVKLEDMEDYASSLKVGNRYYLDVIVDIFKAVCGAALVLMIVFTIIAIVKQEWENAHSGFEDPKKKGVGNNKGEIIGRLFKNLLSIIALPLTMFFLIMGVNSILTSFNEVLNVSGTTVAGQVLATSTYDANKYRTYANANQRVPITITAYNNTDVKPDEYGQLAYEIKSVKVQSKLTATAANLVNHTFLSFNDTLVYKNNKFYNSSGYEDYYENFVCTAEQYQVMADFVDYAQKSGINYYIKSMDEIDIDWGYVNSTIYDKTENSLKITYCDANDIDKDGDKKDTYTMTLAPSTEVTTPISDAMNSIMAMLGIGEYGENVYKVMERDDSGDFLNLVQWANEKALIYFTDTFDIEIPSTWADTDEIIVYEFYHFASNNTFGKNTLADFELSRDDETGQLKGGVQLDVYQICYRDYYPAADAYSSEKYIECVLINGNYYRVEKSDSLTDVYGNAYYELSSLNNKAIANKDVHFLDPSYTVLTKTASTVNLKLSGGFNINNPCTRDGDGNITSMNWTIADQILVYEYYKDLTVGNDFSKYGFADFYATSSTEIKFPVYEITDYKAEYKELNGPDGPYLSGVVDSYSSTSGKYVLINGTYYNLVGSGPYSLPTTAADDFLTDPAYANSTFYNYKIKVEKDGSTGFTHENPERLLHSPSGIFTELVPADSSYEKYQNFNLQLSERFDYTDISTWSYRDYFVFYLFSKYKIANSIDALKYVGIQGKIGTVDGEYCFQTEFKAAGLNRPLYIYMNQASLISELNISAELDVSETLQNNDVDSIDNNLFISFDSAQTDKLVMSELKSLMMNFSSGYDYYDVSTWTVLDFILTYFSETTLINPVDKIAGDGYETFVYTVEKETVVETINGQTVTTVIYDNLYKFGQQFNSNQEKTVYLSEYNVLNKIKATTSTGEVQLTYGSINEWFNKNMYQFICELHAINPENLISTYSKLTENLFTSYESYIYSYRDLVEEIVGDHYAEEQSISAPVYIYNNESFDKTDLSTWNQFDFLYHNVTNSVPTGMIIGQVIVGSDNKLYANIGKDKYVNISDGAFKMQLKNESTITSTLATINPSTTVATYYNSIKSLVETKSELSNLKLISLADYAYKSGNTTLSKTGTYTVGAPNDLDIILAYCNNSVTANTTYRFKVYFDSVKACYYAQISDDYFVNLSMSGFGDHYFSYRTYLSMTLQGNAKDPVFTQSGTYNAFDNQDASNPYRLSQVNLMDTVVTAITGTMERKQYKVFKHVAQNKYYIVVEVGRNTHYVEYIGAKDTDLTVPTSIDSTNGSDLVDYLYNTYYKKLYLEKVTNVEPDNGSNEILDSTTSKELLGSFITNFDIDNMTTWNPMSIILYKLGIITSENNSLLVDGKLLKSIDGTKRYFSKIIDNNGTKKQIYIDITSICKFVTETNTHIEYSNKDEAILLMNQRAFMVADINAQMVYSSEAELMAAHKTFSSFAGATYGAGLVEESSLLKTFDLDVNVSSPNTWNWLKLVHYYEHETNYTYNQSTSIYSTSTETFFEVVVLSSSGQRYTYLKSKLESNYFHLYLKPGEATSALTKAFVGQNYDDKENIQYTDAGYKPIDVIYYKLTGQSTGKVDKFFFTPIDGGADKNFYYIQSIYNQNYYGVYNVDVSGSIKFDVLATDGTYKAIDTPNLETKEFIVSTLSIADIRQWDVFDFIVHYATGNVETGTYSSKIYKYNSGKYFVIGEYYINLTALEDYVTVYESNSSGTAITTGGKWTIDLIGLSEVGAAANRDIVLLRNKDLSATEKTTIQTIDQDKITNATTLNPQIISFSTKFDANDYKTWTIADFIIYYTYVIGFYTEETVGSNKFGVQTVETVVNNGVYTNVVKNYEYYTHNFQSFINNGGAPGYIYHLQKEDAFGNAKTYKVINFGNQVESNQSLYFNYDVFMELYTRKLVGAVTTETDRTDLVLGASGVEGVDAINELFNFYYRVDPIEKLVDFVYNNFYFYDIDEDEFAKYGTDEGVTQALITAINNNDALISGVINLKLSSTLSKTNTDTWSLLDYIVMYEFSRSSMSLNFADRGPTANLFYNMKYKELETVDNYVSLYSTDGTQKVLALNGHFYNLTDYLTQKNPETINFVTHLVNSLDEETSSLTTLIKSKLNEFSAPSGSFPEYLKSGLSSYSDPATKKAYALLTKMKEICMGYISSGSTDEDSVSLAEFLLQILNQQAENETISEESLRLWLHSNFEKHAETLRKQAEYVVKDELLNVNMFDRTEVPKRDEDGNIIKDGDGNIQTETVQIRDVVSVGTVGKYDIKTLVETIDFTINRGSGVTKTLVQTADTVSYVVGDDTNVRYYKKIYSNTKAEYQISLTSFATYVLNPLVREVSWPQKLMNDMQVLYPDLKWETLIATDGWLDTLGEYTSAYTNGLFETVGNSANTTAAGLVLSEFFLSVANQEASGHAAFTYKSLFDESVIKSLMLSILGEQNYRTLSLQAEIFVDMFNTSFAAILDDIAYESDIEIQDGQVDNFVMCVYKSYLATLLLSSDLGEYLYTIATRVYAEYTIYESLACAAGDYASYYAFVNDYVKEDGSTVDSFIYSSFYDLVAYENKLSGNSTPMYTFSMYNVYEYYELEKGKTKTQIRTAFNTILANESQYYSLYLQLSKKLKDYYDMVYARKEVVPDNSPLYCFMYETYYAIYYECYRNGDDIPFYLNLYKDYIDGNINRWGILKDDSIKEATYHMSKYNDYVTARNMSKISIVMKICSFFVKKSYDNTEDMGAFEAFISKINIFDDDLRDSVYGLLESSYGQKFNNQLKTLKSYGSLLDWLSLLKSSEEGSATAWNKINELYKMIPGMIEEVYAIIDLSFDENPSNNRTPSGSTKLYQDYIYEDAIDALDNLYLALSDYINSQKIIDEITKASITFTLGQYGQNYVSTGYNFNIENRNYTFNSYLSAPRLAEYVYGGAYLENFGIEPVYTSEEFEGIVKQNKIYDSEAKAMKISLGMWTELRDFAGELANYTAKLYYTSNLTDVAANISNGVKMTDYIYGDVQGSVTITQANGAIKKTTLEYLILQYLITKENISADTFIRLIFGDTKAKLEYLGNTDSSISARIDYTNMVNLAAYLEGESVSMSAAQKRDAVLDYLIYIQGDNYTTGYYNNDGNVPVNMRIHTIFNNVLSYLLISEEQIEKEDEEVTEKEKCLVCREDIIAGSLYKACPECQMEFTFKEFKQLLMLKIADYEQNPSETGRENANRYLALFNLITAQYTYYTLDFSGSSMTIGADAIGTSIKRVDIDKYEPPASPSAEQLARENILTYVPSSATTFLYSTFDVDKTTKNLILKLAGLSNRPIEELVNLEYDSLYNRNGLYDEALGDVFIICTLDNDSGKFIPVLARGQNISLGDYPHDSLYYKYYLKYDITLQSEYLNNSATIEEEIEGVPTLIPTAFPIIAKGVISSNGLPTGIRIKDGEIQFYRTNITAATSVDADAVSATASVSEVKTVGYTSFVESSSHKKASGTNKKTMFIGSFDLKQYVNSKTDVYYMQDEFMYVLPTSDDFGGLNVLDQFSAFYIMAGQTYILLLIGISTMLPILFNATAAVLRRVLDMIFLTLVGPLVISMKSLDTKEGNKRAAGAKAFDTWKTYVEKTLLNAFGYIIAFNVYYILAQTVLRLEFVSELTISRIKRIGGLGFISKSLIEAVMKYVYLIGAASMVKGAATLLLPIITAGKAANPFAPAVGSDLKKQAEPEVMESVKGIVAEAKNTLKKLEDISTGQALIDLKDAAIEKGKDMLPGSHFVEGAVEKGKDMSAKAKSTAMAGAAMGQGVPPTQAANAAKQYYENEKASRQLDKDTRTQNANNFMDQHMSDFKKK